MTPRNVLRESSTGAFGWVRFAPDGRSVALSDSDGLTLWRDLERASAEYIELSPRNDVSFEFVANSHTLVRWGFGDCTLWDLKTKSPTSLSELDGPHVWSMYFPVGDDPIVIMNDATTIILQYDLSKQKVLRTIDTGAKWDLTEIGSDGEFVVCAMYAGRIELWDVDSANRFKRFEITKKGLRTLALSSGGAKVACGFENGDILVLDSDGKELVSASLGLPVYGLKLSPDGTLLAVTSAEHNSAPARLSLIDQKSGKELAVASREGSPIRWMDFSSDSSLLATASIRGEVCLWDIKKAVQFGRKKSTKD
jgi:WD40 repeat protein